MRKIITDHVYPPIPDRSMDWSAVFDDYNGPGDLIGTGPTEAAAIADLHEQCEDRLGDDMVFCTRCGETMPRGADEGCRDFNCGLRA